MLIQTTHSPAVCHDRGVGKGGKEGVGVEVACGEDDCVDVVFDAAVAEADAAL